MLARVHCGVHSAYCSVCTGGGGGGGEFAFAWGRGEFAFAWGKGGLHPSLGNLQRLTICMSILFLDSRRSHFNHSQHFTLPPQCLPHVCCSNKCYIKSAETLVRQCLLCIHTR